MGIFSKIKENRAAKKAARTTNTAKVVNSINKLTSIPKPTFTLKATTTAPKVNVALPFKSSTTGAEKINFLVKAGVPSTKSSISEVLSEKKEIRQDKKTARIENRQEVKTERTEIRTSGKVAREDLRTTADAGTYNFTEMFNPKEVAAKKAREDYALNLNIAGTAAQQEELKSSLTPFQSSYVETAGNKGGLFDNLPTGSGAVGTGALIIAGVLAFALLGKK